MRRSITSMLILSFATVLIGPVAASEIIRVPGDFGTIASAIDTAGTGDTIIVAPGTYREDIEIKKGMNLQGAGTDTTTLIGAITVEDAAGVTIDGLTVEGHGPDAHFGIWCSSSSLTISNNVIVGYHHGIGSESSKITIENNSVLRNFNVGIQIESSITTLIKGNTVADNVDTGIRIALSEDDVLIADNVITGNRVGIECVQSAPKIRRNAIEGNQIGIQSKQEGAPDLGKDDDPGFNVIKDNKLQVMNTERHHTIQAKHNYWGHSAGPDTSGFEGRVNYTPWLETDPLKAQAVRSQGRLITTWGGVKKDRLFCSDDLCGAIQ